MKTEKFSNVFVLSLILCLGCGGSDFDNASATEPAPGPDVDFTGFDCDTICRGPMACVTEPDRLYNDCMGTCPDREQKPPECLDIWVMYARCATTTPFDCSAIAGPSLVSAGCADLAYGYTACKEPKIRDECDLYCNDLLDVCPDSIQSCLNTCYSSHGGCISERDTPTSFCCNEECIGGFVSDCSWAGQQ